MEVSSSLSGFLYIFMFKLISYNVNGLNSDTKRRTLRKIIANWKPTVLLIQEIKINQLSSNVIKQFWGMSFFYWRGINAWGAQEV